MVRLRLKIPRRGEQRKGIVREALSQAVRERALVGFDFPYSYPAGFADALGLDGSPWSAIWRYLDQRIEDDARNANNRFQVADEINARVQPLQCSGVVPTEGFLSTCRLRRTR
jgi:hypothetical protein